MTLDHVMVEEVKIEEDPRPPIPKTGLTHILEDQDSYERGIGEEVVKSTTGGSGGGMNGEMVKTMIDLVDVENHLNRL